MTWKTGDPWTIAASIRVLLNEVNATYPGRSKKSDGTIGDPTHALSVSDHNPNALGVVRAIDITHDPKTCPGGPLADQIVAAGKAGHPAPWYVIWDRRIASRTHAWHWLAYNGPDPHTKHVHVSVVEDPKGYQSTKPWNIDQGADDVAAKDVWDYRLDNEVTGNTTPAGVMLTKTHRRVNDLVKLVAAQQQGDQATIEAALKAVLGSLDD